MSEVIQLTQPSPTPGFLRAQQALAELEESLIDWDKVIPRFVGCFYGDPGVGKTVLVAAIAQMITPPDQNILMIDTSDGYISLRNHPSLMKRLRPFRFENLRQLEALESAIRQGKGNFIGNVGTIIIDEISTISRDKTLDVAKEREAAASAARESLKLEQGALDWRDYGISQNEVYRMFSLFKSNPRLNIICTAHAKQDNDSKKMRPGLSDGIASDLMKAFQVLGYLTTDIRISRETKGTFYDRKVQVHPTTLVSAKSRIGGFTATAITHPQLVKGIKEFLDNGQENDPAFKPMTVETDTQEEIITPGIEAEE